MRFLRPSPCVGWAAVLWLAGSALARADAAAPLTNLAQVYASHRDSRAQGVPVDLQAQVTYADLDWNMLFIQDASGALYLPAAGLQEEPRPGDWVCLTGATSGAGFDRLLTNQQVRIISHQPLPTPEPATESQILSGTLASRWVEVEGRVRLVTREDSDRLRLDVLVGTNRLQSFVRRALADDRRNQEDWVGARVRVRGVCSNRYTEERVTGAGLLIPSLEELTLLEAAGQRAALPVLPIAQVLQQTNGGASSSRVRVRGTVAARRNTLVTLRDETGTILAENPLDQLVRVNDLVDVWGFPTPARNVVRLEDASFVVQQPRSEPTNAPAPLQNIDAIRALGTAQADAALPVSLAGVVTYADATWKSLILQDNSGAIFVKGWIENLEAGERVAVLGETASGQVANMVKNATVRRLGRDRLPRPVRFSVADLLKRERDCAWVELTGVVRAVGDLPGHARLDMANTNGTFQVLVPASDEGAAFRGQVDAVVQVQGVNTVSVDEHGNYTGVQIRVPGSEWVQVTIPAPADTFALPVTPIGYLRDTDLGLLGLQRLVVQGVVTLVTAGGDWCVQDSTGAVLVRAAGGSGDVEPGASVRIAGFPTAGAGGYPELEGALLGRDGGSPPVSAIVIEPEGVLAAGISRTGRHFRELVTLEGMLMFSSEDAAGAVLTLQRGAVMFSARCENLPQPGWDRIRRLPARSVLRLTGICDLKFREAREPVSLEVRLRTPKDVEVISAPAWWSRHVGMILALALITGAAGVAWVLLLRRRVAAQTRLIRERLEAEATLEHHLAIVWETSADGMLIADASGRVQKVNDAYCRMVEGARRDLEGAPISAPYLEPDPVRLLAWHRQPFESEGHSPTQEQQLQLRSGRRVWFEITRTRIEQAASPPRVLLQFRDVTGRRGAELERERLLRAVEQAEEILMITDARGTIQYVNPTFETITGYTRAEAIGQNPRILKSGRHDAAFYRALWSTLRRGETWTGRLTNRRKDGSFYTEEATISPVRDASGATVNYVAAKRDVTREILLEEQLRQAQKMESVGRLAGGVAHDFNNMLGVILGQAELALERVEPSDPLRADLAEIRQAARRSAELTRQLLTFARKQTVTPRVLDLNETVDGMLKMLRRLIGEDITLAWLPGHNLYPVKVDPAQIDQMLANLCVNSRDAISGVGQVTIKTHNSAVSAADCVDEPGVEPGDYVTIVVSDTGCGMSADVQAHLFEPFFSTKGVGRGTGLGLATVYGAVKQNGGFIQVHSQVDQGSTFKIHLPAYKGASREAEAGRKPEPRGGPETILLVEDEPAILKLTQRILEAKGYRVLIASKPTEALRLAEQQPDAIQLLITDVVMPEMNGRDLAQRIAQLRPGLRSLFMSGYPADVIAHHGVLEGGVAFLQKPFSRTDLTARVREVLDAEKSA